MFVFNCEKKCLINKKLWEMVCIDIENPIKLSENVKPVKKIMDLTKEDGDLIIRRIAGGSVITYPPTFSPDGEYVYSFFLFPNCC